MTNQIYVSAVLRLLLAVLLGGVIGFERAERGREAGVRTHIMVCLGSCLVMLISEYISNTLNVSIDVTRLGAQVISGIGFLGVGCIITGGNRIKGLTTAAGLWVTACIGLAIGIGYYFISIVTVIIMILVMLLVTPLSNKIIASKSKVSLTVISSSEESFKNVSAFLESRIIKINSIEKSKSTGDIKLNATLNAMKNAEITSLICKLQQIDGVFEIRHNNR